MEDVEKFATSSDPIMACCLCRHLLKDAVQLKCLHSGCRNCFDGAASRSNRNDVVCGLCGSATQVGAERPNGFLNCQVQRYRWIVESRVCSPCKENGEKDRPALLWCPACGHSLCEDCSTAHTKLMKLHVTHSLDELKSLNDVRTHSLVQACAIHNESVNMVCVTCEQIKCVGCCAECMEKKHELSGIGQESFKKYVGKLVDGVRAMENEMLTKLEVLEKQMNIVQDALAGRDRHLEELKERKRRVVEAIMKVYEEIELSTENLYEKLQVEGQIAEDAAERVASSMWDAKDYISRLIQSNDECNILNQHRTVRERLKHLSEEVDTLSSKLARTTRAVKIDFSLPNELEKIFRQWIGTPIVCSVPSPATQQENHEQQSLQPPQSWSFGAASGRLQLPISCWDVALTKNGCRLLAAAGDDGLIELSCSSGSELSRWQSNSSQADWVQAVASLSDGRAAVCLLWTQCIVLLRRGDETGSEGEAAALGNATWTEDRRFDQLSWQPGYLSAHGNLLVSAEWGGRRLQLLSLSSSQQQSSERQRQYTTRSLAVASRSVITLSRDPVEVGGSSRAVQLLDAHSLEDSDERLWRRAVVLEEEKLQSVCADSSGCRLFAAVQRSKRSSGSVRELSLADGSELRSVVLSVCSPAAAAAAPMLLPVRLSLSDDCAAAAQEEQGGSRRIGSAPLLAVLCWDLESTEWKTVTVHKSSSS